MNPKQGGFFIVLNFTETTVQTRNCQSIDTLLNKKWGIISIKLS